jgi:hypothetical protein
MYLAVSISACQRGSSGAFVSPRIARAIRREAWKRKKLIESQLGMGISGRLGGRLT